MNMRSYKITKNFSEYTPGVEAYSTKITTGYYQNSLHKVNTEAI